MSVYPGSLGEENKAGNTPIYEACNGESADEAVKAKIVEALITRIPFLKSAAFFLDKRNNDGCTPLCAAARLGHAEVAGLLIRNGADIALADRDGWVILMH